MRLRVALAFALLLAPAGAAGAASPPPFAAKAVLVADGQTGEILYSYNADARLPMASITKVMTALVVLERARPGELVTVGRQAPAVGEASIGLREGEQLSVRDLLAAALIPSANDAAYALASYVGEGSAEKFVALMNERAEKLGLSNTRYVRPDGLDVAGHYSSARDIFALARVAMRKPLFRKLVKKKAITIAGGRRVYTRNDLLRSFPGTIGVKTGQTEGAGWSEVAAARRDGVTIYAVLLGGPSRAQRDEDLEELLSWGFDQYGRVQLVVASRTYATAAVPFSGRRLRLVAAFPLSRVVRLGHPVVERVVAPAMVRLPVRYGDPLGRVCVTVEKRAYCRRLVAAESIAAPGIAARLSWYAGHALDGAGAMLSSVFGGIL